MNNPIKRLGKSVLCKLLEYQVRQLRRKHDFKIVAVAGSVGKTSTKLAISKLLASTQPVRYQDGNYNDRLTVPLIFFDEEEPGIFNIFAWIKLLWRNHRALRRDYSYKYVVLELGTDAPGQLKAFAYLEPEIVVITAVAAEHMEQFQTLDAVAAEELAVASYAKQLLINVDDTPEQYIKGLQYKSYALEQIADYRLSGLKSHGLEGSTAELHLPGKAPVTINIASLGHQGAKISLAAASVADLLGYEAEAIQKGLVALTPVAGRMQILPGKNNSTIIDDTYNASPIAVQAALEVLYEIEASQRVAVLGSMNELGVDSAAAHQKIGRYCDPSKLALVVTVGEEAAKHLAPAAEERGCAVKTFTNPYEAGAYLLEQLKPGAIVLAKGSQNGVFAEEVVKQLLNDPADAGKLVRQSPNWLKRKEAQFKR